METIKLNDIPQLNEQQLENAKIRFMVSSDRISFNPNLDAEDVEKTRQNKPSRFSLQPPSIHII